MLPQGQMHTGLHTFPGLRLRVEISQIHMSGNDELSPAGSTIAWPQQNCCLVKATVFLKSLREREGHFLFQLNPTFKSRELCARDIRHRRKGRLNTSQEDSLTSPARHGNVPRKRNVPSVPRQLPTALRS